MNRIYSHCVQWEMDILKNTELGNLQNCWEGWRNRLHGHCTMTIPDTTSLSRVHPCNQSCRMPLTQASKTEAILFLLLCELNSCSDGLCPRWKLAEDFFNSKYNDYAYWMLSKLDCSKCFTSMKSWMQTSSQLSSLTKCWNFSNQF